MIPRPLTAAFLIACCAVAVTACGGSSSSDDDTGQQPPEESAASLLFVQGAQAARVSDGRIVLTDATTGTLAFSDRPFRRAGTITTTNFVARFRGAFANDPPNAAVSVEDDTSAYVVELSAPRFDQDRGTLSYAIARVSGSPKLPRRTGPLNLFIDSGTDLFERLAKRQLDPGDGLIRPPPPSRFEAPPPLNGGAE